MKTITVSLPDDYAADVEARVAAGEYDSLDEAMTVAVAERLALLEQARPFDLEDADLRAKIRVGLDQADRGEVIDLEVAMARLRARTEAKLAALTVPS